MQSEIRKKLIQALSKRDGGFISGQEIADATGTTRTAVWKHIEELRKDGYEVEAVRKKGYRLVSAPDKMSADSIRLHMKSVKMGSNIHYYETVASTQKIANELANNGAPEGTIVVADEQTAGRGRLARQWVSPKGTGIWMSLILKPDIPIYQAPQLTLLSAVAAVQGIEQATGAKPEIKWPNDLLMNGRKVSGILTEMQAEADGIHSVIIGIGINVNQQQSEFPVELQTIATSLAIETGTRHSREACMAAILAQFESLYSRYCESGFSEIKHLWEKHAISIGKVVTAVTARERITGTALGITDEGVLLVKDESGSVHRIFSADIEI